MIHIDNRSAIALTKNHVFHGRSKHIHKNYHFIRECVENGQVDVQHIPGNEQRAETLTKAQDVSKVNIKLKGENVGSKLDVNL